MARVIGPYKLRGKTGDTVFCDTEDGNIMKMKGGASEWQVANAESMEGTRRVNREFKRASAAATLMRRALVTEMDAVKNSKLSGRMNGMMLKVIESDRVSDAGERKVSMGDLSLLAGFEFSHKLELEDAVPLRLTDWYSIKDSKVVLNLPAVRVRKKKCLPALATHYRLVSGILSIDFEKRVHRFSKTRSELFAMGRKAGGCFDAEHVIADGYQQGYLWLVGIEFYKMVKDKPVLVKGGTMRVMEWIGQESCEVRECDGVAVGEMVAIAEARVVAMEEAVRVLEVPAATIASEYDEVETWERALADAERMDAYAEAIWEAAFAEVEGPSAEVASLEEDVESEVSGEHLIDKEVMEDVVVHAEAGGSLAMVTAKAVSRRRRDELSMEPAIDAGQRGIAVGGDGALHETGAGTIVQHRSKKRSQSKILTGSPAIKDSV